MAKFKLFLLVLIVSFSNSLYSQDWNKILNYDSDASYLMADKQFGKAAETFKKAVKLVPESASFKFKVGYCYLNTDDNKSEAIPYLEEAVKKVSKNYSRSSIKDMNCPTEALYLLADAYRINRQFDLAIETYKKYKEYLKPSDILNSLVDQNIASCVNIVAFESDSLNVKAKNLGNVVNNDLPNINAVISGDGNTMAFTNINKTGNDIYISRKLDGNWGLPIKITSQLGDKFLLTSFLSYDGKDLYLTSDDPVNCDLQVSTIEKNKWIKPLKFKKPINTKSNETHVCLTKDGNTMYFTSDRKGSLGGFDIFKSTVTENGVWGEPVNLGPEINTKFNEATPFLSPDEKFLYFSSEGHGGAGGYDIFFVNLEGTPKVQNVGYPLNNSDNNLFYYPENGWKAGIISYYDKKGFGQRDIYHLDISRYINLVGRIIADANDPSSIFRVRIFDTETKDTIAKLESNSSNGFKYKVGSGNYQVLVNNNKYLPFAKDIAIPGDYTDKDFSFDVRMQPAPVVVPVIVSEVVPKEVKKDSVIAKPVVTVAEVKKPKIEKPKEIKKTEEVKKKTTPIKIVNSDISTSNTKITTYAVQLMALDSDVGADYFKNLENVEITTTPEGIYRYSVGTTESMEAAMVTLKKVKELGYEKAFVRIDSKDAVYTIQLMALKSPVDLSYFKDISDVKETKGNDGYYRYSVGSFSNLEDAKATLVKIVDSGHKDAFVRKVGAN
jgi:hypothetical protein